MVFDCEGDVVGEAVVLRVVAAHDALQLRELSHHVGQQVGLREHRGLVGALRERIVAELLRNRAGQRAHALDALALRAELVVIDHLRETGDA